MIISQDAKPTKVMGRVIAQSFSIEDEGLLMKYLQNNIYSNKPKAICQEIMSNARDAHREIGNHDKPIFVKLPNEFNPTWECQDWGMGIHPARVSKVFIRYGASTKRNDNTQTGGFGIGAKVPFSYAESFVVTTISKEVEKHTRAVYILNRINPIHKPKTWARISEIVESFDIQNSPLAQHVKRTYVVVKNGPGNKPCLNEVGEGEITEEPTGTTISITVQPADFAEFAKHTVRVSQFWKVRPVLAGSSIPDYAEISLYEEGPNWKFTRPVVGYNGPYALIDGIAYPIATSEFILSKSLTAILKQSIFLEFNVGELTLALNREVLDYSKQTKTAITSRLLEIQSSFDRVLEEKIAHAKTWWQANIIFNDNNTVFNLSTLVENVKWKGLVVTGHPIGMYPGVETRQCDMIRKERFEIVDSYGYHIPCTKDVILVIDDIISDRIDYRRLRTLRDTYTHHEIYVFTPDDRKDPKWDEWKNKNLYTELEPDIIKLSTVIPAKIHRTPGSKTTVLTGNVYEPCPNYFNDWRPTTLDYGAVKGVYFTINGRGRKRNVDGWKYGWAEKVKMLKQFKVLTLPVYAFPSAIVNSGKLKRHGWMTLDEAVEDSFKNYLSGKALAIKEIEERPADIGTIFVDLSHMAEVLVEHKDDLTNDKLKEWIEKSVIVKQEIAKPLSSDAETLLKVYEFLRKDFQSNPKISLKGMVESIMCENLRNFLGEIKVEPTPTNKQFLIKTINSLIP